MQITNISEAKASLSKLVERVSQGEEIVIGKAGRPIARLVPYHLDPSPRKLGVGKWRDQIRIADDFDDSAEEILSLFEGDSDELTA